MNLRRREVGFILATSFKLRFIYVLCVCVCLWVGACVEVAGPLGLSLPFYHVGLKDWTWGRGVRLSGSTFTH